MQSFVMHVARQASCHLVVVHDAAHVHCNSKLIQWPASVGQGSLGGALQGFPGGSVATVGLCLYPPLS